MGDSPASQPRSHPWPGSHPWPASHSTSHQGGRGQGCGAGEGGSDPGWVSLSLAFLLQQLFFTLLQPPNSSIHPQSSGWSTHLSLCHGGHPQVFSESASLGQGHARFGLGAPGSASVLVRSLVGDTHWPGKGDTPPPPRCLPFTTTRRQRSAKLPEQPTASPSLLPHRNPKPPIFVFSFLLLGRFPAIESFLGALQRKSGRPIHLLNQSEQCWAGRRERPPATPCLAQAGTRKGPRNRLGGPRVTPEQGDG